MIILVLLSARMMTATTSWNLLNFFKSSWISWWTALSTSQRRDFRRQHNERQLALTQICYNALLHKTGEGNISDRQPNSVLQRQHQHGQQRVRPPLEELRLGGDPLLEVCKSHHICMSLEKCPFIPNANAFLFDWLSEISIRCFLFSANYAWTT